LNAQGIVATVRSALGRGADVIDLSAVRVHD